jgi:hypothetical protein
MVTPAGGFTVGCLPRSPHDADERDHDSAAAREARKIGVKFARESPRYGASPRVSEYRHIKHMRSPGPMVIYVIYQPDA